MRDMAVDGSQRYYITKLELRNVKTACRHMGLPWKAEAARPVTARLLSKLVHEHGIVAGCDLWAVAIKDGPESWRH